MSAVATRDKRKRVHLFELGLRAVKVESNDDKAALPSLSRSSFLPALE